MKNDVGWVCRRVRVRVRLPLKLVGFSGGSVQESVKPQTAAIPAAVLIMDRN